MNNGGICIMKKKFIELPKENTVIAMMENKHSIADEVKTVNKNYAFILNRIDFVFGRKESSNPYYKSTAVADVNDTFDAKVGREIAGQKTDYKYHKSMVDQYNRHILLLENMIDTLEKLRNRHIDKKRRITDNMKRFI